MEALTQVHAGEADLCIVTPASLMKKAITGDSPFPYPMPSLRALAVLPQNDRMVLAIHPKHQIRSFDDLRRVKPALRIATSVDDGTNFIGHIARRFMEAHGISEESLQSWGGRYVSDQRPDQSLDRVKAANSRSTASNDTEPDEVDAVLQEAIMTPWWRDVIDNPADTSITSTSQPSSYIPLPAEPTALAHLHSTLNLTNNPLPAGYWSNLPHDLPALDFSDFVIVVRDDMRDDVAQLLTWCLVETRGKIEAQYKHLKPERSPLSYPLDPRKMARTPFELHVGARAYYEGAGYL